ncbi:hypothetical protein GCM10010388_68540 [Streptomyces mauvecolor]
MLAPATNTLGPLTRTPRSPVPMVHSCSESSTLITASICFHPHWNVPSTGPPLSVDPAVPTAEPHETHRSRQTVMRNAGSDETHINPNWANKANQPVRQAAA